MGRQSYVGWRWQVRSVHALEMARRLIFLGTTALVVGIGLFAIVASEARLALLTLGLRAVAWGWWLTTLLPARPISVGELRAAATAAFVVCVGSAVLIPRHARCANARPRPASARRIA